MYKLNTIYISKPLRKTTKDQNTNRLNIYTECPRIVYYKLLWNSNWCENDYNWSCFYSNEILCMGCGGNEILFWITNMTNYYPFTLKLLFVQLFTWKRWYFFFNFVDNLLKDLTHQQIDDKIQMFHLNDFKKFIQLTQALQIWV